MTTSVKLAIAGCMIALVTAYMAYLGTAASWQYYLTVDECLADVAAFVNQRIRLNGKVATGSLRISARRERASFQLEGNEGKIAVSCTGPLPDNLAEDMDVVIEGQLEESGAVRADKVFTRCASKYASESQTRAGLPQVSASEGRR